MSLRRLAIVVALPLLIGHAAAGSAEIPELTDPPGDQETETIPIAPWGAGADLLAAWFTDDEDGLTAHLRVADLQALEDELAQVDSDFMLFVEFRVDHNDTTGRAGRDGTWKLRADLQPQGWSYWGEAPCVDGHDADGCAGSDRDIMENLSGGREPARNEVWITLPWKELGMVAGGDMVTKLQASTQVVYPAWPVYLVDWDVDQRDTATYAYVHPPTVNGTPDSARQSPPDEESPGPTLLAMVTIAILGAAFRRRGPAALRDSQA